MGFWNWLSGTGGNIEVPYEPVELEVKAQAGSTALPALDPDAWAGVPAAGEQGILVRQATVLVGS